MLLHQGIWRECIFARALSNLAWWCEVENLSAAFSSCWSISHDCEITFHIALMCCSQHPSCFISHDCAKISHGHAKSKIMLFRLLFAISLISSCLIHLHHLQLSSKAWSKCISLLLSLCIWIIINFIYFLQLD